MKYVKDQDGKIYKAAVISQLPVGFEEITIPVELQNEELRWLEHDGTEVVKKTDADKDRRNEILMKLRELREVMLKEADVEINKIFDAGGDTLAWSTYRQALRDVPAAYIKVDGDPKVIVDSIDLENFTWPAKPE